MASSSGPGFTFQANGEDNPRQVSGSGSSRRHLSDSESEICPTAKSLARLCSRDKEERATALEDLSQMVLVRLGLDRPASGRLSKQTLLHLLRLSRSCPLQEVQLRATELLRTAEMMTEGPKQEILIESFLSLGRVDHLTMVMALHPSYLSCFLRTQHALFELDGPLPRDWRHYISIMAAARHHCSYKVQQHSTAFLEAGGEESWLSGLEHAPTKLRGLQTLNKLLAHRPWLITQQHIQVRRISRLLTHSLSQELVCAGAEPRWSLAELIHAVILMAHTHSLCSFVWGCGLNPEPDHIGGYSFHPPSPGHVPRSPAHEDGRQEDYSWEDHGFSLVQRLLPDMGQFLDEEFQVLDHFIS
ncbi:hypothetical protein GOODEAATRI_010724 [Goodea atripinnis]|uniref:Uncharacterized protein n=1 Tax=Goodea atripinnis TaxID=208336 RepID=A0ABV0PD05_9TELE